MSSDEVNWRAYLAEFHRERAGIAEAVLSRALWGPFAVSLVGASGVGECAYCARYCVRIRPNVA